MAAFVWKGTAWSEDLNNPGIPSPFGINDHAKNIDVWNGSVWKQVQNGWVWNGSAWKQFYFATS